MSGKLESTHKRDFFKTLGIGMIAAPVAAITAASMDSKESGGVKTKESAYQRLFRTRVLKAGWFEEPPFTIYNPNTQERTGIVIRIVERFAADFDIKVQWETISNFAMMGQDLATGKYDAICASLINMPRAMLIDSCDPFVFVPMYAYVRADDNRFHSHAQFNDPSITISGQEGTAATAITQKRFPKAKHHMLTNAELSDMLVSVASKKADVVYITPSIYEEFNKNNPGKLKPMSGEPLQLFTFSFGVAPEQDGLKSLFNNSLHRMMVSGEFDEIFAEFDPTKTLLRPGISFNKG